MDKLVLEKLIVKLAEQLAVARAKIASELLGVEIETGGNNRTEVTLRAKSNAGHRYYGTEITLKIDSSNYRMEDIRYAVYKNVDKRQTIRYSNLDKALAKFVSFTKDMIEFASNGAAAKVEQDVRDAKVAALRELTLAHLADIGLTSDSPLAKAFNLSEHGECWIFRHSENHYSYRGNSYQSHFPSDKGKALTVEQARQLVELLK